jgi:glutathione S-transferase
MKLYYAPGACSLADHIALLQAGLPFEHEKVDLQTKRTDSGADFKAINSKGYVPALVLDSGETLTENIAILDWIARQNGALTPPGSMGPTRLLEALAYISTELHKSFKPFFQNGSSEEKAKASETIQRRFAYLAETMHAPFLLGADVSVADFYLFVMLLWARTVELDVPTKLAGYRDRMMEIPAVQNAMKYEGLIKASNA